MHRKGLKSMLNSETTPMVRHEHKGYTYRFRPEHHIETPEGDIFYLKYAFDPEYVPQLSEVVNVIDTWTDWSA